MIKTTKLLISLGSIIMSSCTAPSTYHGIDISAVTAGNPAYEHYHSENFIELSLPNFGRKLEQSGEFYSSPFPIVLDDEYVAIFDLLDFMKITDTSRVSQADISISRFDSPNFRRLSLNAYPVNVNYLRNRAAMKCAEVSARGGLTHFVFLVINGSCIDALLSGNTDRDAFSKDMFHVLRALQSIDGKVVLFPYDRGEGAPLMASVTGIHEHRLIEHSSDGKIHCLITYDGYRAPVSGLIIYDLTSEAVADQIRTCVKQFLSLENI